MKAIERITATGGFISGTATSQHDSLPFFNGRKIADTESPELTRLLIAAGIEGVSASNPREANLAAYGAHLGKIRKTASDNAIAAWLANPTDVPGISVHNGASTNQALRDAHLDGVGNAAADRAQAEWLKGKSQ